MTPTCPTANELNHHDTRRRHDLERQSIPAHCLHRVANAVIDWNTICTQLALTELPWVRAADERAGLTPTLFEHVNPLGTCTFDTDRRGGHSAASAAA
jgi:Tn3 transposase DDE domain